MTTTGTGGTAVRVRPPAVAGTFYPGRADALARTLDADLAVALDAERTAAVGPGGTGGRARPKALIVPHAGYVYSGPIAAIAYARLLPWRDAIRRVVLLGPAHRVPVASMAVSRADAWETPLGAVLVDADLRARVLALPGVESADEPHAPEHSLEVQIPFLQRVLAEGWTLLPIIVGQASHRAVAAVLDEVWGGDETLIVVSSDLSHYNTDRKAKKLDRDTARAITDGRWADVGPYDACGAYPVRGMLLAAEERGLSFEVLDLRNSSDTAGDPSRVVGYGAFLLTESTERADDAGGSAGAGAGTGGGSDDGHAEGSTSPRPEAARRDHDQLDDRDREVLLAVADEAVRAAVEGRRPNPPSVDDLSPAVRRPGGAFVTLRRHGELRGCIGSISPTRSLHADVAANARSAATQDPRFEPLHPEEVAETDIHVSVLTPTEELDVANLDQLRAVVRPGVDGLLIEAGRNRGTFLPSVWEQLPDVDDFLAQLWRKAGLKPATWPRNLRVSRYQVDEFESHAPRPPLTPRRGDGWSDALR